LFLSRFIPDESGCWKAMTPEVCGTNNWTKVSAILLYRLAPSDAAEKQKGLDISLDVEALVASGLLNKRVGDEPGLAKSP